MNRRLRTSVLAALLLLLAGGAARADRLHLDSGGHIDVARWWIEGDWVMYEGAGGTVGIPRAMIVRIEPSAAPTTEATDGNRPGADARRRADDRPGAEAPQPGAPPDAVDRARIESWIGRGAEAYKARDFETAAAAFHDALTAAPDAVGARVGYALSEMSLGRDGHALSVVLDGLALDDSIAELHELLGDLRDREERVDDALKAWRRSFELEPRDRVRDKILKAEREQQAGGDFEYGATAHFTVRYDGEVDATLATAVMDELEQRYIDLGDLFNHSPPQPITVLLYPRRAFREVTQSPEWVGGLYDGKIRVPLGGLTHLDARARAVLAHELTHAIVHSKTRQNCPRWLHEGLAQIVEGRRLDPAQRREVAARLAGADPAGWESGGFSYPLALSLTRFLESRQGFSALVYLLDVLGEGDDVDDALTRVYGEDYAALCRRWAAAVATADGGSSR